VWRQVLAVHLIYTGLGIILFAPLLGVLGQLLLKLSGKPALADTDLLFFVLSPVGAFAFGLFAVVSIVIIVFEFTSLMAVGVVCNSGRSIDVTSALGFSFASAKRTFHFAAWLLLRLLVIVAPFLLAAVAVFFSLLSDYDINYYLAVRPTEFWAAAIILGALAVAMVGLLVYRLVNWALALPLMLFANTPPKESFSASSILTRKSNGTILITLIIWTAAMLLLGAVVAVAMRILAGALTPQFMESVAMLAVVFGALSVVWLLASVLTGALAAGSLAVLLVALADMLVPWFCDVDLQPGIQGRHLPAKKTRRWLVAGLAVTIAAAFAFGSIMLNEIEIDDDVQIIAHRGASGAAPENTLASVRQALQDGTDWVEIDVQETADGEIVVVHDSDLMKLAGVNLRIWDATLQQLAEIDVGSSFGPEFSAERVPTLKEVLAEVKGRSGLMIELKYYGHDQQLEQRVINLVEATGMRDDTVIMSLQYAGIQKVRELRPDWKVGLLSARAIGDLTRLDADFLAVNRALARPVLINAAHEAGKELFVWTVNDVLAMSQMISLGVDGLITDEPLLVRKVLMMRAELSPVERLMLHMAPLLGIESPSLNLESDDAESEN